MTFSLLALRFDRLFDAVRMIRSQSSSAARVMTYLGWALFVYILFFYYDRASSLGPA